MSRITIAGLLLLSLVCTGCVRDYAWDPSKLDDGALERPFQSLESGTQWRLLRDTGNSPPGPEEGYWVHYKGWRIDENGNEIVFDESYSLGVGMYFAPGAAIAGFYDGMLHCPEGGMIELIIPPEQGYGDSELEKIPPNSTLHFRVELLRNE